MILVRRGLPSLLWVMMVVEVMVKLSGLCRRHRNFNHLEIRETLYDMVRGGLRTLSICRIGNYTWKKQSASYAEWRWLRINKLSMYMRVTLNRKLFYGIHGGGLNSSPQENTCDVADTIIWCNDNFPHIKAVRSYIFLLTYFCGSWGTYIPKVEFLREREGKSEKSEFLLGPVFAQMILKWPSALNFKKVAKNVPKHKFWDILKLF